MPGKIKVIPNRFWISDTGSVASIYGATPWIQDIDKKRWKMEENGFTWEVTHTDGSVQIGLGRTAARTYDEAIEIAKLAFNGKYQLIQGV